MTLEVSHLFVLQSLDRGGEFQECKVFVPFHSYRDNFGDEYIFLPVFLQKLTFISSHEQQKSIESVHLRAQGDEQVCPEIVILVMLSVKNKK
jgi:hypothetical protein